MERMLEALDVVDVAGAVANVSAAASAVSAVAAHVTAAVGFGAVDVPVVVAAVARRQSLGCFGPLVFPSGRCVALLRLQSRRFVAEQRRCAEANQYYLQTEGQFYLVPSWSLHANLHSHGLLCAVYCSPSRRILGDK